MGKRLGLGKNNHLTYACLALNPRYDVCTKGSRRLTTDLFECVSQIRDIDIDSKTIVTELSFLKAYLCHITMALLGKNLLALF